jgi:hypothetical protein
VDHYEQYLSQPSPDLTRRVELIQEAIRHSVERRPDENVNDSNIRHMDEFFAFLKARFPGDRFRAEVQPIPKRLVRTTDRNFVVTVPGRSADRLVLVAHYDTWAGFSRNAPGADDNTTGEEVLKQYLLNDLRSESPPPLTHVYLFAGSEECGTRGLVSQLGLTVALSLASLAISTWDLLFLLAALPFAPLANYRFGVTGTRYFVEGLSDQDKQSIRAAIAVDSVGEGRLYIPENEMGANFLRALVPYEGSEHLNDLLEEAAHLHHIKYNRFLSGGTTDSVAFLEERRFLPGAKRATPFPAAALITMSPGKCSPFVAGGKLHTSTDTPDRVYAQPLAEVLTVLDYAFHILEGGQRPPRPRSLSEHHYARLYRDKGELFLALKDAVEPNRRNLNSIFRVRGVVSEREANLEAEKVAWWGVETTLDKEMKDFRPRAQPVDVDALQVDGDGTTLWFEGQGGLQRKVDAWVHAQVGRFERFLGRYSFIAMFGTAIAVAFVPTALLEWAVVRYRPVGQFVADHYLLTVFGVIFFELAVLFRLFTRELPAWMDNAYRHQNRADNMRSLRRTNAASSVRERLEAPDHSP